MKIGVPVPVRGVLRGEEDMTQVAPCTGMILLGFERADEFLVVVEPEGLGVGR